MLWHIGYSSFYYAPYQMRHSLNVSCCKMRTLPSGIGHHQVLVGGGLIKTLWRILVADRTEFQQLGSPHHHYGGKVCSLQQLWPQSILV